VERGARKKGGSEDLPSRCARIWKDRAVGRSYPPMDCGILGARPTTAEAAFLLSSSFPRFVFHSSFPGPTGGSGRAHTSDSPSTLHFLRVEDPCRSSTRRTFDSPRRLYIQMYTSASIDICARYMPGAQAEYFQSNEITRNYASTRMHVCASARVCTFMCELAHSLKRLRLKGIQRARDAGTNSFARSLVRIAA
jgi:hypothetical protein